MFDSVKNGLIELEWRRSSFSLNLSCRVDLGILRALDKDLIDVRRLKGISFIARKSRSCFFRPTRPFFRDETSAGDLP